VSIPTSAATVERLDNISVMQLVPTIDDRVAPEFERQAVAELDAGIRLFVIDFGSVKLITSAGVRTLLILRKRLGLEGDLVLCGMTQHVNRVFEIAGLSQQLPNVGTRDEAVSYLKAQKAKRERAAAALSVPQPSALSRRVAELLGAQASSHRNGEAGSPSDLTVRVAELLHPSGQAKP
jgi:anti-anti-sigma factor